MYLTGSMMLDLLPATAALGVGIMLTPQSGYARHAARFDAWAADTGCFTHPERFDLGRYLAWLGGVAPRERCLFACAPDRVGDAAATLAVALPTFAAIRGVGVPVALVAQNGLDALSVPWREFDALFIGGDDAWKTGPGALGLCCEARARKKHIHMGRVNSLRRLRTAQLMGCDSADGTFLARGPHTNLPRLRHWLARLATCPTLPLWGDIANG